MAFARAEAVAGNLLERYLAENRRYPRAIALVLWGLDNIKTQGEGVAQAFWLLGVRPVRDALNRVTEVEAIPLEELKRPRNGYDYLRNLPRFVQSNRAALTKLFDS